MLFVIIHRVVIQITLNYLRAGTTLLGLVSRGQRNCLILIRPHVIEKKGEKGVYIRCAKSYHSQSGNRLLKGLAY